VSQCKECVSELSSIQRRTCQEGTPEHLQTQRGASRLLNTLEGKVCAGESTARVVEYSESSARRALSRCKCAQVNSVSSSEREKCQGEDTPELLNTLEAQTRRDTSELLNTLKERLNKECFE
jgi:hypothetical protein